jgi:hypothetical protein
MIYYMCIIQIMESYVHELMEKRINQIYHGDQFHHIASFMYKRGKCEKVALGYKQSS